MSDPKGFLKHARQGAPKEDARTRTQHSREFEGNLPQPALAAQASRCMQCGIPFCHQGCPLGNYIPEFNAHTEAGALATALARLHATNNFPEFTGRLCPAPCEEACVLNLEQSPVSIKLIERQLIDAGFAAGQVRPEPPQRELRTRVAIVGSGPAGLAAAQQLRRAGHAVQVFEKAPEAGGLLRYGIPDFKLERRILDRRLAQLRAEGVDFRCNTRVGETLRLQALLEDFDAVLLAVGAESARDLPLPGASLRGVLPAMRYLNAQNRAVSGAEALPDVLSAHGKRVMIIGAGDTASDCLGTALRQGAVEVLQLYYKPAPPSMRSPEMPWPWWPPLLRQSSSHEEGGEWRFAMLPEAFVDDGQGALRGVRCRRTALDERGRPVPTDEAAVEIRADMALLAIGFRGVDLDQEALGEGIERDAAGRLRTNAQYRTGHPRVFACGDATRGASLIVWAIWEGREAAQRIDAQLRGRSYLPTLPAGHPLSP